MKKFRLPLIALLTAGLLTIAFIGCKKDLKSPALTSDAKGGKVTSSTQYGVPTLACNGSTDISIDLLVTADATTGAPSGFTVQWMTKAEYDANIQAGGPGWPLNSDSPDPAYSYSTFCKASFSGNANLSRYNLGAGEGTDVNIGDLLYDNGASTNCPGALQPCTEYVFRVFAHGDSKMNRSDFSSNTICSTLCQSDCGKHGYGYWRNHCEEITLSLTLGSNTYSPSDICDILNENPSPGNGLLIVAHHLITAELNGLTSPDTDAANTYIGNNLLPTSTNGSTAFKKASTAAGLISTLVHFNETCPQ